MKQIIFIAVIAFSTVVLHAQEDSTFSEPEISFYKQEIRISFEDAFIFSLDVAGSIGSSFSVAYFYRYPEWFWIGVNFVNYFGGRLYYECREYFPDGNFRDFTLSKMKYCAAIAPEFMFSYLNRKSLILYSAISFGIGWENGYDNKNQKYPNPFFYIHNTCFGFSCNFGKNKNIFLGGELGLGYKGFGSIHGGYRF